MEENQEKVKSAAADKLKEVDNVVIVQLVQTVHHQHQAEEYPKTQ